MRPLGRRVPLPADPAPGLPDFVDLVVLAVRSGLAPAVAISIAGGHSSPEIRAAVVEFEHRRRRGQRTADALLAFVDGLGTDAAGFVDALAAADRYGLPIEPVLDRLALDARDERRRRAERRARTLPVRLAFPLVVCTLPSFVLLAIVPAVLGALAELGAHAP